MTVHSARSRHETLTQATALVLPHSTLVPSYVSMLREGFSMNFPPEKDRTPEHKIAEIDQDHQAYINQSFAPQPETITLPDGTIAPRAPSTRLWLVHQQTNEVLGAADIRHYLTPALTLSGGNIGYGIRPSCQGKGLGKHLLKLTLDHIRTHLPDLRRVLLTVIADNAGSIGVIKANGGTLWKETLYPFDTTMRYHYYWIEL